VSSSSRERTAPVDRVMAGDIAAVAKLKDTVAGDTLVDEKAPIVYARLLISRPRSPSLLLRSRRAMRRRCHKR